jgi:hypothetical protein
MIPGISRAQRQEQRHTLTLEEFIERVIVLGALCVIMWLAMGGTR